MRRISSALLALGLFLTTRETVAQDEPCPYGKVCVDQEDMIPILDALHEKKCLLETPPKVTSDALTIVTDRQGRIYGSGSNPVPFQMTLNWCNYEITAKGQTRIMAAQRIEPSWGFRFRPKATFGVLGTELLGGEKFTDTLDGGLLLEPFYVGPVNVNGYVGLRSGGAGLGLDVTKNFGVGLGYAITWGAWRSNPFVSLYFAFW